MTTSSTIKNLEDASKEEQLLFLKSFDTVLSDVDGVVAHLFRPIDGATECMSALKILGKKVAYVTNHGATPIERFVTRLNEQGLDVDKNDIFSPAKAIVWYLNKVKFDKTVYVVGMAGITEPLVNAGYKVIRGPGLLEFPTLPYLFKNLEQLEDNVGAVIYDIDINLSYMDLEKAVQYLELNKDVIFITGGHDPRIPISKTKVIIGSKYFVDALEEVSGKKSIQLAKPSVEFNKYIQEELNILEPSKVLFIGDAIREDMGFASNCGYQKLLVLSGTARKENIENWNFPNEWKPNYYVDSLKTLGNIIKSLHLL